MATYEYVIKSGCTSTSYDHYHSANISDVNSALNSNIPKNAYISSAKVYLEMYHKIVLGTIGNGDINIWFSNEGDSNSGTKLHSGKTSTSTQYINIDISGYLSSRYSTFALSTPYPKISVYYDSTTRREYHCNSFKIIFEWYIPTYTVTVNAGTGGTVSGGGTVESGNSVTITATPNTGYKFVKWNDGDIRASRSVTVTGNATYTAEFAPQEYPVNVICEQSVSGEVCTVSGAGTYKFGDTVTLKVTNIPPHHSFDGWDVFTQKKVYRYDTETITFTLNADTIGGNEASIDVYCYILHTGYKIGVNVYPDTSAGTVQYVQYRDGTYYNFGDVTNTEVIMKYEERGKAGLRAKPLNHYTFVKWSDGNTDNPRLLPLTDDATYTAVFGVDLLYIGNQLPKAIYVGTQEVKEVFIGTERVYLKSDY